MSAQRIIFYIAIALLVVAVLLAGVAVYVFFSQGILSVMDDLSGRTRDRGIGRERSRKRSRASNGGRANRSAGSAQSDSPSSGVNSSRPLVAEVTYDTDDGSDDMPTVVTSVDAYYAKGYAQGGGGVDLSGGQNLNSSSATSSSAELLFRVTKRIVLTHSDGVITAG